MYARNAKCTSKNAWNHLCDLERESIALHTERREKYNNISILNFSKQLFINIMMHFERKRGKFERTVVQKFRFSSFSFQIRLGKLKLGTALDVINHLTT